MAQTVSTYLSLKCLLALCLLAFASQVSATDAPGDEPSCDRTVYLCEDYQAWQVRLGMGLGARTNPLVNSSDIPLVILPHFSYYGERFFVDNLNLGYTLFENKQLTINLISDLNFDRVFFSRTDPANILLETIANSGIDVGALPGPGEIGTIDIDPSKLDRKISYYGGLGLIWAGGNHRIKADFLTDISSVHDGQELQLKYRYLHHVNDWTFNPFINLTWKSAEVNTYYYGFTNDEFQIDYVAGAGINVEVGASLIKHLDEHWMLLGKVSYIRLSDEISTSPLVEDDHSISTFFGAVYTF